MSENTINSRFVTEMSMLTDETRGPQKPVITHLIFT